MHGPCPSGQGLTQRTNRFERCPSTGRRSEDRSAGIDDAGAEKLLPLIGWIVSVAAGVNNRRNGSRQLGGSWREGAACCVATADERGIARARGRHPVCALGHHRRRPARPSCWAFAGSFSTPSNPWKSLSDPAHRAQRCLRHVEIALVTARRARHRAPRRGRRRGASGDQAPVDRPASVH